MKIFQPSKVLWFLVNVVSTVLSSGEEVQILDKEKNVLVVKQVFLAMEVYVGQIK